MTQARARKTRSFAHPNEDGLLTKDAFDAALLERGVELTPHQIRTWRTRGLLPHAQRGGLARYGEDSVAQAVEAARLFAARDNEAYVGWQLWWRGHDVAELYWRPVLEKSSTRAKLLAAQWARFSALFGAEAGPTLTEVIWRVHAAAEDVSAAPVDDDKTPKALAKLKARQAEERERVLAEGLDPFAAAAQMMRAIAATPHPDVSSLYFKAGRVEHLEAARDDVRSVLEAAAALYDAAKIVAPGKTHGLRALKWLHDKSSRAVKATLVLRWLSALEMRGPIIGRADIVQLRADAFATLSRAKDLKRMMARDGRLADAASRRRIADATRRADALEALCGRVRRLGDV